MSFPKGRRGKKLLFGFVLLLFVGLFDVVEDEPAFVVDV